MQELLKVEIEMDLVHHRLSFQTKFSFETVPKQKFQLLRLLTLKTSLCMNN